MKNQFNLEINNPCDENFNEFTPTKKGGFCDSCQKEVIDFTKMNSEEIINYFKNNLNQDTCGKFITSQLTTYTENSSKRKKYNFWSGIGLACLSLFSFNTIQAQTTTTNLNNSKSTIKEQEKDIIVKGIVTEETTPLPGVSVVLQGTTIGTETDFDGKFEFPKSLKKGDVLVFSFLGMQSKKVTIDDSNSASKIELKVNMTLDSCVLLGKVAVKKVYKSK